MPAQPVLRTQFAAADGRRFAMVDAPVVLTEITGVLQVEVAQSAYRRYAEAQYIVRKVQGIALEIPLQSAAGLRQREFIVRQDEVIHAQVAVAGRVQLATDQLAQQQRPTLKVRDYVSLPRTSRCARTVAAKPRAGADVRRVRLAVGKRVSAGKQPRLKLKSKRSKVTVTVTLRDGTTAIERLTYRRCG